MSFREFSHRFMEPGAQWVMVLGIIFLCQPWVPFLHTYSVVMMIAGLVTFLVAVHVPAPEAPETEEGARHG